MPQGWSGRFSIKMFDRYQRSEKTFVSTPAEMYIQGGRLLGGDP